MVGGLTAKADAHYKRDVSSILPIPESPQGVQALDDGGSVAGRQRESWLFLPPAHPSVNMSRFGLEARKGYFTREPSSPSEQSSNQRSNPRTDGGGQYWSMNTTMPIVCRAPGGVRATTTNT